MMKWVPPASVEVLSVAVPLALRAEVPISAVPARKLTVPVGVTELPELTFAVNVTD